ncbi:MAG: hypothetical protein JWQ16_1712, partial [Novosphingobium sp.]|nr:hypothetical protein [Novosphingobium sp.]
GSPGAAIAAAAPVTIHVYQLPGENGDALAARITRILDQRDGRRAAAARSSYRDDD